MDARKLGGGFLAPLGPLLSYLSPPPSGCLIILNIPSQENRSSRWSSMLFIYPNFSLEPTILTPRCGHGAQQYHTASTNTNHYSCMFRAIGIGLAGKIVGCKTACTANLDGTPQDSANCCTGSHNVPATCPPSDVQYYSYFKNGCKNAYAYAYDESSKTALGTCDSSKNADYAVTFCP